MVDFSSARVNRWDYSASLGLGGVIILESALSFALIMWAMACVMLLTRA